MLLHPWSHGLDSVCINAVLTFLTMLLMLMEMRDAPKSMLEANDEQLREGLLQRLIDAKLMGPTMQLATTDPAQLPTRELPHGNVAELYMVFVAFCGDKTPASRPVFYREAKRWKQCLTFRRPLAHSLCQTCSQLQAALANCTEPGLQFKFTY